MNEVGALLELSKVIGGPATLGALYLLWRLDNRITRLETKICFLLAPRKEQKNGS